MTCISDICNLEKKTSVWCGIIVSLEFVFFVTYVQPCPHIYIHKTCNKIMNCLTCACFGDNKENLEHWKKLIPLLQVIQSFQ